MTRIRCLPLALTLALGVSAAHADDLMQIYQESRRFRSDACGRRGDQLATDENVDQARALLLPQVAAALSFTRTTGGSNTPSFIGVRTARAARTRSRSGHRRPPTRVVRRIARSEHRRRQQWMQLKTQKFAADAGSATYDAAQQQLIVNTAQTYFNVLTSLDALKFADANEKGAEPAARTGAAALRGRPRRDHRRHDAKRSTTAAVANVISAQNAVDQAREAVRQLTNKEPGEFKKLREDLPLDHPNPDDPKQWVDLALKQNPVLSSAALNVDAANANINSQRAGHLPTLNAHLGYSRAPTWGDTDTRVGTFHDSSDPQWGGSIGVTLSVPIFTGGLTQSLVRQAIYNRDFAQGPVRSEPPSGRSRDAQQFPLGHRGRERSRSDQGRGRVGAVVGRSHAGRLRSRHTHDRRRADPRNRRCCRRSRATRRRVMRSCSMVCCSSRRRA